MYDLKGSKSCSPQPRTGQFSKTWRVRGQDQELDPSRPRTRTSKTVLEAATSVCDVTMMLLRSQSISYFNVRRIIWLKGCLNGNP